ncbi:hypothetical protein EDC01DRAFT_636508 [Geopyxis carbonaria]|nr:hypothetical protein EDC01DRAFT_636508 [Geopyxis carbonaria]
MSDDNDNVDSDVEAMREVLEEIKETLSTPTTGNPPSLASITVQAYLDYAKFLSKEFPQLKILSNESGRKGHLSIYAEDIPFSGRRGEVQSLNSYEGLEQMHETPYYSSNIVIPETTQSLSKFIDSELAMDIKLRLIVVEDLDPLVIEMLGNRCKVDPGFFAEHLQWSGYSDGYQYRPVREWNTSYVQKSYLSLEWRRPVKLSIEEYENLNESAKVGQIQRPWKELDAVPFGFKKDKSQDGQGHCLVWTERASVWSSPEGSICIGSYQYSCVFQSVKTPEVVRTEVTEQTEVSWIKKKNTFGKMVIKKTEQTQILRTKHFHSFPPWPCRERKSIVPEFGCPEFERMKTRKEETSQYKPDQKSTFQTFLSWWGDSSLPIPQQIGGQSRSVLLLLTLSRHDTTELLCRIAEGLGIVNHALPNDSIVQERVFYWRRLLVEYREQLQTSLDGIENSLSIAKALKQESQSEANRWSLPQWSLSRRGTFSSLKRTATVESESGGIHDTKNATQQIYDEFKDLESQALVLAERVEQTSQSLMSTLSIVESQRAISEAESVTKLTELAFFFIPISFSATLFGMQVQEFEKRLPISVWVIVAFLVVLISYIIRFMTRSTFISHVKYTAIESIRRDANLPLENTRIPNRAFLVWALISEYTIGYLALIISVAIISVTWGVTTHLNRSFKVMVTIIMLIMFLVGFYKQIGLLIKWMGRKGEPPPATSVASSVSSSEPSKVILWLFKIRHTVASSYRIIWPKFKHILSYLNPNKIPHLKKILYILSKAVFWSSVTGPPIAFVWTAKPSLPLDKRILFTVLLCLPVTLWFAFSFALSRWNPQFSEERHSSSRASPSSANTRDTNISSGDSSSSATTGGTNSSHVDVPVDVDLDVIEVVDTHESPSLARCSGALAGGREDVAIQQ